MKGASPGARVATQVAATTALAVAGAAINRATYGCYTPCGYGTVCDPNSGTCVARSDCGPTDPGCTRSEAYLEATAPDAGPAPPASSSAIDESCAGFCLSTERCVVYRGDLDCVPR
jgi:hypothetical protein